MQARELAVAYPTVTLDTDGLTAVRLLTEHNRPGLIVVDEHDHPIAVLPGSRVLRVMIPSYVQEDPTLAKVLEHDVVEKMCAKLRDHTVRELVPTESKDKAVLPVADPDDTALEVAAMMAAARSPLVAVLSEHGKHAPLLGAVTVYDLLGALVPGPESTDQP